MGISAVIFGCSGLQLTEEERLFFKKTQPWGFILFGRNIETPKQVAELVQSLKDCVDHGEVPVLIDQEGGRVRRLRPPHWPPYHSGSDIGAAYHDNPEKGLRFAWLQSRLMAFDLIRLGINVDCLPVLDVPVPGSHDVIGDRAYSTKPDVVAKIGRAAAQGLLDGGVIPVIKHIPGHGRAGVDSHQDLPRVAASLKDLEKSDFYPFKALSDMPTAMTAHVVYESIDREAPATTSQTVIETIIRGKIGFDGLLMCDDLSMHALSGDFPSRTQSAFAAGCDVVLHCNGVMAEMVQVADGLQILTEKPLERANFALDCLNHASNDDEKELRAEFARFDTHSGHRPDPTEALTGT